MHRARDPLLAYAAVLSLLHPLVAASWVRDRQIARLVTTEDYVCWPLLPGCHALRAPLDPSSVYVLLAIYAALGLAGSALFFTRRRAAGFVAFAAACVLGLALYALDYRLRSNQAYMFGWIGIVFLFGRKVRDTAAVSLCLFYAWAGWLKLGPEWLSGAALYETPLLVPRALLPAACAYVVVLEIVVVWGLLSTRPVVRWSVYAQLVVFHVSSWKVVGFFYPLLMLGLTSIFPLSWLLERDASPSWRRLRAERPRETLAAAAVLSALQLVPRLYPGDTAVTGEGRMFALHMFDARVECEGYATLRAASGETSRVELVAPDEAFRIRCDPVVIAANARNLCRKLAPRWASVRVDVAVDARRSTDPATAPLVRADDVCAKPLRYAAFGHNPWIRERR
ncbi:MAG: hypothetical protein KF819_00160 [Labilithrix sp.]|nr:hypothetical protein [Labilithrix sp.]